MQKDVQITVVGKVYKPNRSKVLALNKALNEYFRYLSPALIQTARDKAVEILKSFRARKKRSSLLEYIESTEFSQELADKK